MAIVDEYYDVNKWQYISQLDLRKLVSVIIPLVESNAKEDYLILSFDYRMYQIEKDKVETIDETVDAAALTGDGIIVRKGKKTYRRFCIK